MVRPASGAAREPILLVLSTSTWNAYNDWGGPSLYTGGTRVSFERPLAPGFCVKPEPARRKMQPETDREGRWFFEWAEPLGLSVWSGGAGWWNWERPFVRWAEQQGFGVDVAISQDLEQHPEVLEGHRFYASVGHDEYWSWGMREALDGFTDGGGHAMILSGNTCFWQVRFDDDHRAMTCFKYLADQDPVVGTPDERFLTGPWSDRRIANPETSTIGLTFTPRRLLALRARRPAWVGRVHGAAPGALGVRGHGPALRRRARPRRHDRGVRGGRLRTRDGPDGLPVPTHADGAPENLEVLATAPARLWTQDEQPSRYAHEPGELENTAMARVRSRLARPGAPRHEQPRVHGGVLQARRRHRLQRRRHRLGLRAGVRRPRRRPDHPQRDRTL